MRSILIALTFCACTTPASSTDAPAAASVRARLTEPTRLFISATPDAGMLGAEHYADGAWLSGTSSLSITDGALVASVGTSGELEAASFDLSFDPIDIPEDVFGEPAQLTDVRLQLASPVDASLAWSDDNDATATITLALQLSWTLSLAGGSTPLGMQQLPPMPLDVTLGGTGELVTSSLALHATGDLWSWADILKLTALDLAAAAATVDN